MPTRTISTRLAIDGEAEYKRSITNINNSLKVLQSELAKVESEYKGNEDSIEALRAKKKALSDVQTKEIEKIKGLKAALENAKAAQKQHADAYADYTAKISAAAAKLKDFSDESEDGVKAQEELTTQIKEYQKAQSEAQSKQEAAGRGVEEWQKKLNYAERDLNNLENQIKDTNRAMEKATDSTKQWTDGLDVASTRLNGMGNKLSIGLTAPLVAAGAASFEYAKNAEESLNKVYVAFGSSAGVIERWSQNTLKSIGLAKGTALDMAALYGDMATSMGYGRDTAAEMSKTLVNLAADMASFKNIGIEQANTALKSIFTGETERLKGLGVVMTEANLKAFALAEGYEKDYKQLTQLEKVQLRYEYILSQTSNSQGDFARTSEAAANQQRILEESLKEAAQTAGKDLLPVITPIIKNLGEMVQAFSSLDEETRKSLVQAGLFLAMLGPTLKLTGGLTSAVSSAVTAYQALKTAQAAAAAAQTGVNVAMNASPIGMVITGVGVLVSVLTALSAAAALTKEDTETWSDALRTNTEAIAENRKAREEQMAGLETEAAGTMETVAAIQALAETENKTAAQKETLLALVGQLNEAVPGLSLAYDGQTDSLNLTTEAIRQMAQAQAEQAIAAQQVENLSQLYIEQQQLAVDLATANEALAEAEAKKAEMVEAGTYGLEAYGEQTYEIASAIAEAKDVIEALTDEQGKNAAEVKDLEGKYAGLTAASEDMAGQTGESVKTIEELTAASSELAAQSNDLTAAQDLLSAALKDQSQQGSISLGTINSLIDAGYAAALTVDTETGAVTLNRKAYIDLANAKIDEQIASVESQRQSAMTAAQLKQEALAALDAAVSTTELNKAKKELADIDAQVTAANAQIASLEKLKGAISSYTYTASSSGSTVRRAAASTTKKVQTEAESQLAAYKTMRAQLDHQRAMEEIDDKAYYERLAAYRDEYLTDDSSLDDHRKITEEIYKYDRQLAEDESKLWAEQTERLADALEGRLDDVTGKISKMEDKLSGFGDLYSVEDDVMELNDLQDQIAAIDAYAESLARLKDAGISDSLLSEITDMDVGKANDYMAELLAMTPEDLEEYNRLWEEKKSRASEVAAKFYVDEIKNIETEYNDKLSGAMDTLVDTAYESGKDTAQGLIDGLSDKEQELYTKARSIADEVSRLMASTGLTAQVSIDGSHAGGLPYVPFDGYVAQLHKGERVLTAEEARAYIARAVPQSLSVDSPRQPDIGGMLAGAVNAMGTAAAGGGGNIKIENVFKINGKELYRETIDDLRSVMHSNPEVR